MKRSRFVKRAVSVLSAAVLFLNTVVLAGCVYDLGDFESVDAYVESFGTVSLTSPGGIRTFDVGEDFYNPPALDHFETHVPQDEYVTFAVPVKRDMNVDEIRLCINFSFPDSVDLTVRMYIGAIEAPFYDAFESGTDPTAPPDGFVSETTVSSAKDEWAYFAFDFFGEGEETVSVGDGDTITLLFLNNTAWGKQLGLERCGFSLTTLLVRAI